MLNGIAQRGVFNPLRSAINSFPAVSAMREPNFGKFLGILHPRDRRRKSAPNKRMKFLDLARGAAILFGVGVAEFDCHDVRRCDRNRRAVDYPRKPSSQRLHSLASIPTAEQKPYAFARVTAVAALMQLLGRSLPARKDISPAAHRRETCCCQKST